ncbi:MAG: hypothetical protein ACRDG3_07655 [Tepidiformaceae bacterium]
MSVLVAVAAIAGALAVGVSLHLRANGSNPSVDDAKTGSVTTPRGTFPTYDAAKLWRVPGVVTRVEASGHSEATLSGPEH